MNMEEMEMKDFEEKTFVIFNDDASVTGDRHKRNNSNFSTYSRDAGVRSRADFVNSEIERRRQTSQQQVPLNPARKLLKIRQEGFDRRF